MKNGGKIQSQNFNSQCKIKSMHIYVTHSQSVDGGARPSTLAEFGKGSVVRAMNWHSHALGSRSQRRGAGTNNNDPWQQSAHTVKETKSLPSVASGLTRLRCLVRVSRALSHETSFRFQQKLSSLKLGSVGGGLAGMRLYRILEAPNHDVNVPNGDVIMKAHARRTGLVDSSKALTRLVESHAPLT